MINGHPRPGNHITPRHHHGLSYKKVCLARLYPMGQGTRARYACQGMEARPPLHPPSVIAQGRRLADARFCRLLLFV